MDLGVNRISMGVQSFDEVSVAPPPFLRLPSMGAQSSDEVGGAPLLVPAPPGVQG